MQMNFALAHVLGATIQTALFNSSLVVIVGWGLHKEMVFIRTSCSFSKAFLTPCRASTLKYSTLYFSSLGS